MKEKIAVRNLEDTYIEVMKRLDNRPPLMDPIDDMDIEELEEEVEKVIGF